MTLSTAPAGGGGELPTTRKSQTINKPVDEVFATVASIGTFPEWNPTIASATMLTEGEVGLGSKVEWTLKGFGKQEIEVTEFQDKDRIRISPQSSMFGGGHLLVFSPHEEGTRIEHELVMNPKGPWVLISPLMGMMARKNLQKTADALQQHLEK